MTEVLREWALTINADDLLCEQGADPARLRTRSPRASAAADRALAIGLTLLEPAALLHTLSVTELRHQRLELEGGAALTGDLVARLLGPACMVTLLVCTIGPRVERQVQCYLEEDPALALALDALGSVAVGRLSAAAWRLVAERAAANGMRTSIPISPGLEGWPVDSGQRQIFRLIDPALIGVTLTSAAQMIPRKSTSQVIGIGPNLNADGTPCDYCGLRETCPRSQYRSLGRERAR